MKVIVTGSIGNISKPLTKELVKKGHHVTVISSNQERQKDIEALGAEAAIGSLEDVDFLVSTFSQLFKITWTYLSRLNPRLNAVIPLTVKQVAFN